MANQIKSAPTGVVWTVETQVMPDYDIRPDGPHGFLFQDPDYQEQDQKRLDAWKRDEWHFVGLSVRVIRHNWETGVVQTYVSPGIWGIESDCPDSFYMQMFREQLAEIILEFPELKAIPLDVERCPRKYVD